MGVYVLTITCLLTISLGAWVYGSARISSGMFINAQCHIDDKRSIQLTFDDGPDPIITRKVMDVLERHGHRGIFFVIGEKVEQHPEIVREITQRGHQIGNHTYSHNPFGYLRGANWLRREIERCDSAILQACGMRPQYFRPPLGICPHYLRRVLQQTDKQCIGWSVRSLDTMNQPREQVLNRVIKHIHGGAIILLHDRLPHADTLADYILSYWQSSLEANNSPTTYDTVSTAPNV